MLRESILKLTITYNTSADDLEQLLHPLEVISTKISIEGLVRPILSLFTGGQTVPLETSYNSYSPPSEIELRRKTHQELGKLIDSVALPSKHLDAVCSIGRFLPNTQFAIESGIR